VIVSPSLRKEDRNTASLQIAANICQEKGIPFMLYNQSDFFNSHPEYFKDATHLNDQGAKIYSQMVSSDMQKILSSKYPK
jgi:lysophospholipase L1-like esterase